MLSYSSNWSLFRSKKSDTKSTLNKRKITWKMAKWDFAWISTSETRRNTHIWLNGLNAIIEIKWCLQKTDWFLTARVQQKPTFMEFLSGNWLKNYQRHDILPSQSASIFLWVSVWKPISQPCQSTKEQRHSIFFSGIKSTSHGQHLINLSKLQLTFANERTKFYEVEKKVNYLSKLSFI